MLLLQQRSKHPREMVITPKASTSLYIAAGGAKGNPGDGEPGTMHDHRLVCISICVCIYTQRHRWVGKWVDRYMYMISPAAKGAGGNAGDGEPSASTITDSCIFISIYPYVYTLIDINR